MGTRPGHPRVPGPVPRLVALLLGVAGAVAAEPRQVSSVLGESVVFSLDLSHNGIVKKLEWTFRGATGATGAAILVAEVIPGGSLRPDPRDRFGDRLEVNETALRITVLERGDCGIYQARIQLLPALVEDQSFNLSLYEPLPEPEIRIQRRALTSQECNLTVRCQAPAGSGAEVTWQPQGHLCGDSQTLCLSLPATASSSSYTCVAGNDIQRRTAAIHTGILCRPQGDRDRLRVVFCLGLVALGVGAAGIAWIWRKKRRKKAAGSGHGSARDGPDGAALAPRPSQDPSSEVQYAEIQRRIPLEPQERPQDNPTTIYSLLQA
ncbi:SLAM family member 9-like [Aphelocoma coerulescens]|uniref:SLAM family member 9-like n=1 Tax=Aphelocoma coerulescens TaxID=39617 RepID=UPI0036052661